MKQMLKKANSRSRRLNTIMEIVESQDENGNLVADSNSVKEEISSDISNAASLLSRLYQRPSRDTTAMHSPRERRIPCSHATPQTLSAASSHWRERTSVSVTPAGVVRSSSELLTGSALEAGHAVSDSVELFFPEFFTDGEMHRDGIRIETVRKEEPNKKGQRQNEDPLVQSWLDLFGSQVCG